MFAVRWTPLVFAPDMFLHWFSDILNIEEKPKKNKAATCPVMGLKKTAYMRSFIYIYTYIVGFPFEGEQDFDNMLR